MRRELNTSKSTFKDIIKHNLMYVDKTKEIYDLVHKTDGQFFLSRPRRFGKSITLSTLKSIFEGDKELFKGLYIYDKPFDWKTHPVIHLSMNRMGSKTLEEFEENLCISIKRIAKNNKIVLISNRSYQLFQELIEELHEKQFR